MADCNSLKETKYELLKKYNDLILLQIHLLEKDNVSAVERITEKSNRIINEIDKINNEIEMYNRSCEDFDKEIALVLNELKVNYDNLIDKVSTKKDEMQKKGAQMKTSRKTISKYNAYNKKTSYGFNTLK